MSMQHSNMVAGRHYNIFIKDSMVVFATQYYKRYNISSNIKIIYQYMLRKVGKLLVYYIQLVLLFQQQLEVIVQEKESMLLHIQPADLGRRKQTGNQLRKALKHKSRIRIRLELTIIVYYKVAISISYQSLRRSTTFCVDKRDKNKVQNKENRQLVITNIQARQIVLSLA